MAIGTITPAQIVDTQFESVGVDYLSACFIADSDDGSYYAICYREDGTNNGLIQTIYVSNNGNTITAIDSWRYESSIATTQNSITKVGNDGLYAIWGRLSPAAHGTVFTIRISDTGTIAKETVDSEIFTASTIIGARAISIPNTNYYICGHRDQSDNSFIIQSAQICPITGNITLIDSLDAGVGTTGTYSSFAYINNGVIAGTYRDGSNQLHFITFSIDLTDGTLSNTFLDDNTSASNTGYTFFGDTVKPFYNQNIIASAWYGPDGDGFLQTASINTSDGSITLLNQLEYEPSLGHSPGIARIAYNGAILIGVRGDSATNPQAEGELFTFQIGTDGSITELDHFDIGTYTGSSYEITGDNYWFQVGGVYSPIWVCITRQTSSAYGHAFTINIESNNADPDTDPSTKLFAPVDAIPVLTSGRSGDMDYSSTHEPKYTLDNNPDTYWKPSIYTTSSLYYDLGSNIEVDAISMWLHNYNERYGLPKAWKLSYSDDDSTYTEAITKTFYRTRTDNSPIIVHELSSSITARYWKIDFLYFNSTPQTITPEISCIWFLNSYHLPWKHQRPEENALVYYNNNIVTRSGYHFTDAVSHGRQRILQRTFMFTDTTGQWTNLYNAYQASRGGLWPIIIQPEFNSEEYLVLYFDKPLTKNEQEYNTYVTKIRLKEMGHIRVPYQNKSLIMPHPDAAIYHFRGDGNDSGLNSRHFTEINSVCYPAYEGISEIDITTANIASVTYFSINSASATWANMGTSSFTIEAWFRSADELVICRKAGQNFTLTGAGFFFGVYNQKMRLFIHDGTNSADISDADTTTTVAGTSLGDSNNQWHYAVMVVDKSVNKMKLYIDGGVSTGGEYAEVDISSINNITNSSADLLCGNTSPVESFIDELTISPGYAMSDNEIANRYTGRTAYGSWGRNA